MLKTIFDTNIPENPVFPFMSIYHIIPLLIFFLALYIVIKNRDWIKNNEKTIKKVVGILLLIIIGTKHIWYMASDFSYIKEGLPLYLCRLTFIVTIFSFLFNSKKLNFVIVYQGTVGGIMGMLSPDISGYLFPHIFYLIYFSSHILLICASLIVFIADDYEANFSEFKKVLIYNVIFIISVSIINAILGGTNYGFTSYPPKSLTIFSAENLGILYKLLVFLLITFISYISHIIYNTKLLKKLQN